MKKGIKMEQLLEDGIVQLKSLRQLQKQGILPKPLTKPLRIPVPFSNCRYDRQLAMLPQMMHDPGKVLTIVKDGGIYLGQGLIRLRSTLNVDNWFWPIECVQR